MDLTGRYRRAPGLAFTWSGDILRVSAYDAQSRVVIEDEDLRALRRASTPTSLSRLAADTGVSRARLLLLVHHGLLVAENTEPTSRHDETGRHGSSGRTSSGRLVLPEAESPPSRYADVLRERRSERHLAASPPISLTELATILGLSYRARGGPRATRCSPSAGRLYPLEIDVVARNVSGVLSAVYRYHPVEHMLIGPISEVDPDQVIALRRRSKARDAFDPPVILAVNATFSRTVEVYGSYGVPLVHVDAGVLLQALHCAASAIGLASCPFGPDPERHVDDRALTDGAQLAALAIGR